MRPGAIGAKETPKRAPKRGHKDWASGQGRTTSGRQWLRWEACCLALVCLALVLRMQHVKTGIRDDLLLNVRSRISVCIVCMYVRAVPARASRKAANRASFVSHANESLSV